MISARVCPPNLHAIGFGSDSAALTRRRLALQRRNIEALRSLGLWDTAAMLRMWSGVTPRSIFPRRRIGVLAAGYERTFLVLRTDPLRDLDAALDGIELRVKQGCLVDP